jgi:hypothetical protein
MKAFKVFSIVMKAEVFSRLCLFIKKMDNFTKGYRTIMRFDRRVLN